MQAVLKITKKDTNKFFDLIRSLLNEEGDSIEIIINSPASYSNDTEYLNSSETNRKILAERIEHFENNKDEFVVFENIDELVALNNIS